TAGPARSNATRSPCTARTAQSTTRSSRWRRAARRRRSSIRPSTPASRACTTSTRMWPRSRRRPSNELASPESGARHQTLEVARRHVVTVPGLAPQFAQLGIVLRFLIGPRALLAKLLEVVDLVDDGGVTGRR